MHLIENENESKPKKKSFIRNHSAELFWGFMIAIPLVNATSTYFGYKTIQGRLELARMASEIAEQ